MLIIYVLHSCNILIGLPVPSYTISNHPLVTATRMILKLKSHVTPLLKTLEWLLITFRKLASLLLRRRPFMIWLPPRHPSPHSQAPISTLLPANPWLCPVLTPFLSRLFSAWTTLFSVFAWMILSDPLCLSLAVSSLGILSSAPPRELCVLHLGLLSWCLSPFIIADDSCLIPPVNSEILEGRGRGFNFCICNT